MKGRLAANDWRACLSVGEAETPVVVPILDEELVDRMLETVPCLVGGAELFCGEAEIICTVHQADQKLAIETVQEGSIQVDHDWLRF